MDMLQEVTLSNMYSNMSSNMFRSILTIRVCIPQLLIITELPITTELLIITQLPIITELLIIMLIPIITTMAANTIHTMMVPMVELRIGAR
jgi:hypothetical protein